MTIRTRLLTLLLCASVCQSMFPQSAAVWSNGAVDAIQQVDSTAVFRLEGKPYLQIWSSDRLVYSDYADSLQYFPVGEDVVIPVTSILLSSSELSIQLGHSETLIATVLPDNATDKTVTWTTSDASIASVKDGAVTANNLGTAIITATAGNKSAECQVTVLPIPAESISLDKTTASVIIGSKLTVTATVLPENATYKTVTWESSNQDVASVENGLVSANSLGEAIITASIGELKANCVVTVIPVVGTSLTLDREQANILIGNETQLIATVLPENTTDKTIIWETSDADIVSVNNGLIKGVNEGNATITAKSGELSASCVVTVLPIEVESVTLDRTTASILLGSTTTLTATVLPDNATYKDVVWTTSDASVASVSNGVVTANKLGSATITATSGTKSAECQITVLPIEVESVTLDRTTASILLGSTTTLTATVLPDNATDKTVTWTTSDASVASVSNGVVTANKLGTATITATSGTKSAECQITVLPIEVESVTLDRTTASILLGSTTTLTTTVLPDNATDKTVAWTTSNSNVAIVQDGLVTAVDLGSAVITAKSGNQTAECKVTVVPIEVESVTLDRESAEILLGGTTTLTATVLPDNATDKAVTWTSSDSSVASVENGVVTAKKVGTATITAKAGDKTATCEITVVPILVTGVSLDKTNLKMIEGDSQTLIVTITPDNATNSNVTWKSSNNSIVRVDQNGMVTAVKAGNASVTVTTLDGGKTATCYITVEKKPNVENPEEGENWDW